VSKRRAEDYAASVLLVALTLTPPALAQSLSPPLAQSIDANASTPVGGETADEQSSGLAPVPPTPGAANYGAPRPRVKLPKPNPPPRRHAGSPPPRLHPLPPLEAYKTSAAARRARREQQVPGEPAPQTPPTAAVTPTIKSKPKPRPDPNPYEPVGIGVGSLRLDPFIETSSGYDDNPDRLPSIPFPNNANDPVGSKFLRADAGLKLKSDWERNDLAGDLRLGYVDYFDYEQASRFDGAGNVTGRYDVTRDTAIDLLGRFTLDSQRPYSPAISSGAANVTVTNRPIVFSTGASAGVTQKFNRLEVSLRGSFDRTIYGDAHYSDGSSLILSGTDFNDYGVTGRVAYVVSPSLKPFAEATYDSRIHDSYLDPYGYARDSDGLAARGGMQVKVTELLTGEASGGWAERDYRDPRLPKLRGPTVDASLIYTPTPLTTLTLRSATALGETTTPGAAGVLARTYSAQLSHDLLRNLTISALGGYFTNNYEGAQIFEHGYNAGVKLDYKITRSITIRASVAHERLNSSQANASYTDNVYMAGLRFQP
jgi:hypothetical protein